MRRASLRITLCEAGLMAAMLFVGLGVSYQTDESAGDTFTATPAFAEEAASGTSWSPDMDCTVCHTAEAASLQDVPHGDKALMTAAVEANTSGSADTRAAGDEKAKTTDETSAKDANTEDTDSSSTGTQSGNEKDAESMEGDGETEPGGNTESNAPSDTEAAAETASNIVGELTCTMCHTDAEALVEIHGNAEDPTAIPKRLSKKIDDETCLTCHGSYKTLAEATADSTVLTDTNGTTVNPHALPETASHESIKCIDCHRVHTDKDPSETASQKCMSCHHQNVYECYTCHE